MPTCLFVCWRIWTVLWKMWQMEIMFYWLLQWFDLYSNNIYYPVFVHLALWEYFWNLFGSSILTCLFALHRVKVSTDHSFCNVLYYLKMELRHYLSRTYSKGVANDLRLILYISCQKLCVLSSLLMWGSYR